MRWISKSERERGKELHFRLSLSLPNSHDPTLFDLPLSQKKIIITAALASSPRASQAIVSIPDPNSLPFTAGDFEQMGANDIETVEAFEFVVPLRVVAPRGAVPSDWATDFRSLLGKRGTLSFEARAQVSDIFKELSSPEKGWEAEEGEGGSSKKKKKSEKALKTSRHKSAATADAVCLSDQWLGPAVSRGLVRPIPGAEEQRWWVSRRRRE